MNTIDFNGSQLHSTSEIQQQFSKLLNKILSMIGEDLFEEVNQEIMEKCRISQAEDHIIVASAIQSIVKFLVRKLQASLNLNALDVSKHDYKILQVELQKREAQIRNHYKIEEQQRLYEGQLTDRIQMLQKELQLVKGQLKQCEQHVQKLQEIKKILTKKVQKYQEKLYEASRQGVWSSVEKKSSDKLFHKASLKMKSRQLDPYLDHASKSKQLITRQKEGSKMFKEKASRMICFESMKMREDPSQSLPTKKSVSYHGSKVLIHHHTKQQANNSIHIGQTEKRRKLRFARHITEADGSGQRKSLYL